jgi:hypothetical protein
MQNSIPYTVDNPYVGQTIQVEAFDILYNEGRYWPRVRRYGCVFINRQSFETEAEAQAFLDLTVAEGATIEA